MPTFNQFPSFSRTQGLEPILPMQTVSETLNREHINFASPGDTNIRTLAAHRYLIADFNWAAATLPGVSLFQADVNSLIAKNSFLSLLWNLGICWHADLKFNVMVVKNSNHSGRLRMTMAYGTPPAELTVGSYEVFKNQVMDFTRDNYQETVTFPFSAATEYLYTSFTASTKHAAQNFSLGTVALTVHNPLRIQGTVATAVVRVLVYLSLENLRLYEMLPTPRYYALGNIQVVSPIEAMDDEQPPKALDDSTPEDYPMTETEVPARTDKTCSIHIGRKFEHEITDLIEVCRRYQYLPNTGSQILVRPHWEDFNNFFAGWAGHLNFRMFFDNPAVVCLIKIDESCKVPPGSNNAKLSLSGYVPLEMSYAVGAGEWLTISVPFNSMFNFLPTKPDSVSGIYNAHSYLKCTEAPTSVWCAAGDDFRYLLPKFGYPVAQFNANTGISDYWNNYQSIAANALEFPDTSVPFNFVA